MPQARAITLPLESQLAPSFGGADLADAFAIALPAEASGDVARLARAVMANPPRIMAPLMGVRDLVMGLLGARTSTQIRRAAVSRPLGAIGAFRVEQRVEDEVVMGEQDRHLSFKTSFLIRADAAGRELIWVSAVQCHNVFGRVYLAAIAPIHRRLLPTFLNNTSRRGWPMDDGTAQ